MVAVALRIVPTPVPPVPPAPRPPASPPPGSPFGTGSRFAARQCFGGMVRVFEVDPDLLAGLDPESAVAATSAGVAPTLELGPGVWTPPAEARARRLLGMLVLDGLLVRSIDVHGARCPELLGRGDLIRPWDDTLGQSDLGVATTWRAITPVTLAVLDARFVEVVRRWPWISQTLLRRGIQRSRSMALQTAIGQLRRADDRLRLLFRDLSARWGKVTHRGVVVPMPLTNQLIAELTSLRRQTASSTMTRLGRDGEIVRLPGKGFLLDLPDPAISAHAGHGTLRAG